MDFIFVDSQMLLAEKRNIWKATDLDKNTPHHIAAKAKNLDMLKVWMILMSRKFIHQVMHFCTRLSCSTILPASRRGTRRDSHLFTLPFVKESWRKFQRCLDQKPKLKLPFKITHQY